MTPTPFLRVIIGIALAGMLAKLPDLLNLEPDYFYQKNWSFIVFPFVAWYFQGLQKASFKTYWPIWLGLIGMAIFANTFPMEKNGDLRMLSAIHIPLLLWTFLAYIYMGGVLGNHKAGMAFIRFNGDLAVMGGILALSGLLFLGVNFALFQLIEVKIEVYVQHYFLVWGLPALPILGTHLVQTKAQLVDKVGPIVARIFTPMLSISLSLFLIGLGFSNKDPFQDRNFLMVFNALLIGVMALVVFSISEIKEGDFRRFQSYAILVLVGISILINGIALAAIVYRLNAYGISPNKLAVLGANALVFLHLLRSLRDLWRFQTGRLTREGLEQGIIDYLPVYALWAGMVGIVFPLLFH